MSRKHVDFVDRDDLTEVALEDGPFAGAVKRVLSRDEATGAETVILTCPGGWTADLSQLDGSLEFLALSGAATLGPVEVPLRGLGARPASRGGRHARDRPRRRALADDRSGG